MLIPYSTDAPVYYWPFATVGLIVANVAAFVGVLTGNLGPIENWVLAYGEGLHPQQWFLSMFMHAGIEHLVGNMLFLWVFGLVVEGKLGWWKFLPCYVGIGALQAMCEQIIMSGYTGDSSGSLGASAAIFGLMGMAAVWAPMNEIRFLFLFFFVRAVEFDVGISIVAAFYAGLEVLTLIMSGGAEGSSWLHLGGMAIGFPLAVALLKTGVVDCEGWDLFHVFRGDYGAFKKEPEPAEVLAKADARQRRKDEGRLVGAKEQVSAYLQNGNPATALLLYEKMKETAGGLRLDRGQLLALIKWLHGQKRWGDSAPLMAEVIARFPEGSDAVRIKLAQICVVELNRPGKALDLLAEVNATKLPDEHAILGKKVAAKARRMQEEGTVELDVDTW
jgi:membrane associated rhomboid family serine protease